MIRTHNVEVKGYSDLQDDTGKLPNDLNHSAPQCMMKVIVFYVQAATLDILQLLKKILFLI